MSLALHSTFTNVLASIPSPTVSYFDLGPIRIHFYALCIMLGIVVAAVWTNSRLTKRGAEPWVVIDICLLAVPLAIIGARIFHVVTHWGFYFGEGKDFWAVFRIWEGGIAIFGALIGGAIGAWIAARKLGARLTAFADALAPGLIIAQAIGRLGNWFNQELFGGPDYGPLGLEIDPQYRPAEHADVPTFQPTFLYEMSWNLAGGLLLLLLDRKFKLGWGKLFALYMVVYGTGRFFIEGIRTDFSYYFGPLRTNQVTALLVALAGLAIFALLQRTKPGREPWVERKGVGGPDHEPAEAEGVAKA